MTPITEKTETGEPESDQMCGDARERAREGGGGRHERRGATTIRYILDMAAGYLDSVVFFKSLKSYTQTLQFVRASSVFFLHALFQSKKKRGWRVKAQVQVHKSKGSMCF
jgi:hypothetical protein